jgi:hypothetical protein
MPQDYIGDDELLYRGVRSHYVKRDGNTIRISSQAFTDPSKKISVDRAKLCNYDPHHTQVELTDYVCRIVAGRVREIGSVTQNTPKGELIVQHHVRVEPDPLPENPAHALIFADPNIQTRGVFRKLQEGLALIAEWEPGFAPETRPE